MSLPKLINPFVKEPTYYKREMDIIGGYIQASATFLHSRHPQFSMEYCVKHVKSQMLAGGTNEIKDPKVAFISQRRRGQRRKEISTLTQLLTEVIDDQNLILSPALIAYQRPEIVKSLLSEFLFGNVKKRKDYKNLKFKYEQEGNKTLQTFYDILQSSVKELNNSLSGAGVSKYNAIYCKSSHLSLTAGCRTGTSYANATNERFIAGNRHYHRSNVVLQELSNAVLYAPHREIEYVMQKYNLHYPTVDEVMECVLKSTTKYWVDRAQEDFIYSYIKIMSPTARAAFVYVGDAFHLSKLNPGFLEGLIEEFISSDREFTDDEVITEDILSKIDGDKAVTVSLLRSPHLVGRKYGELKEKHPEQFKQVNTTAWLFEQTLQKHEDFIDALWRPRYLISSIGKFRSIMREAVLTSDTDSTIFSTMYWTHKLTGSYNFTKKSYNVGYLVVYFASQIVSNALSILCANMGIGVDQLNMLQMKNEYYFPVYGLTNISKHYFALRSAQEGVIKMKQDPETNQWLESPELEIKGVHLVSSKASIKFLIDFQENYLEKHIMASIMADKQLSWNDIMDKPIQEELKIRKDIREGGVTFYSREQIKNPADYKQGEDNSNYFQYLMWREVFAKKYGDVDNPPFYAMKIPVDLNKPRKVKRWIDSMEDREVAERLMTFLNQKDKDNMTSILIPLQIIQVSGLPKELLPVIDEARAVSQIMAPYYTALQTFGMYVGNSKNTRLLTDNYIDDFMSNAQQAA